MFINILNDHHGWATKKMFHSRLPKTVLNSYIFYLFISLKTSNLQLIPGDFFKKIHYKIVQSSFENIPNDYVEFHIHT